MPDTSQVVPGCCSWMLPSFIHPPVHPDSKYILSICDNASWSWQKQLTKPGQGWGEESWTREKQDRGTGGWVVKDTG